MNVLIVYAHDEPTSLTATMKNLAAEVLARQGHAVAVSDLYAQGFNAIAQKWDFVTTSGKHYNYMLEQKHAANLDMSFAPDILGEIQKLRLADLVIFITPIWWFSVPAIMKGWFDRVLAMGVAWDSGQIYESGLLRGKQALLVGMAGGPEAYYSEGGLHQATVIQMLHHVNHGTFAFCGMDVHEPFVALGVLSMTQEQRLAMSKEFQFRLEHIVDSPQWLDKYF